MQGTKDLTQGSIRRQLLNLALPIMGTSFIQMAYSLTDMAWVGRLGSESVAAVGAAGILVWMTNSISLLTKVGSEVCVGQSIGAQNVSNARKFASHNITLGLIIAFCWALFLFLLAKPIISFFRLEAPIAVSSAVYLRIVATAFPFIFLSASFTGIYNAAGRSKIPFYTNGIGLLLNMILDPLFIYGFHLGTIGVAIATWLSQAVVCIIFIYRLKHSNPLFGGFSFLTRLSGKYVGRIVRVGLPVALLNVFFSIINLILARIASTCGGHIGLMSMTAGGQIEAIAWNTAQGFSTALSAFTAQNFAAGHLNRVITAYHTTLRIMFWLGTFVMLLFIFFGNAVFSVFVPERAAYEGGGLYLRIDGFSMILMMAEISTQGLFYGIGKTIPPALISITFNTLRIPMALFFPALGLGIAGVWWAVSISSMLKGITSLCWAHVIKNRLSSTTFPFASVN